MKSLYKTLSENGTVPFDMAPPICKKCNRRVCLSIALTFSYHLDDYLSKYVHMVSRTDFDFTGILIPPAYADPIYYNVMVNPVLASDGVLYDYSTIVDMFHAADKSGKLPTSYKDNTYKLLQYVYPVYEFRNTISNWAKTEGADLVRIKEAVSKPPPRPLPPPLPPPPLPKDTYQPSKLPVPDVETSILYKKTGIMKLQSPRVIEKAAMSLHSDMAWMVGESRTNTKLVLYVRPQGGEIRIVDVKLYGKLLAIVFDRAGDLYTLDEHFLLSKFTAQGKLGPSLHIHKLFPRDKSKSIIKDIVISSNDDMVIMDAANRRLVLLRINLGDIRLSTHVKTYDIQGIGIMECMCVVGNEINVLDIGGLFTQFRIDPALGLMIGQSIKTQYANVGYGYTKSSIAMTPGGRFMVLYDNFNGTKSQGVQRALLSSVFKHGDASGINTLNFKQVSNPFVDKSSGFLRFANILVKSDGKPKMYMHTENSFFEVTE
jgi:hypothetical protein